VAGGVNPLKRLHNISDFMAEIGKHNNRNIEVNTVRTMLINNNYPLNTIQLTHKPSTKNTTQNNK
jgi:hypothetical protein